MYWCYSQSMRRIFRVMSMVSMKTTNLFLAENTEKERRYGCVEERKDASDVSGYLLSLSCINVRLCGCVNIFLVFYSRI